MKVVVILSKDIFAAGKKTAIPSGGFASLCMEFKTEKGKHQDTQKEWQKAAESAGNKYVIIRSFDDFRTEVNSYLRPKK